MTVYEVKSLAEFHEIISKHPIVALDATASWCGPCKIISPVFERYMILSNDETLSDKVYFAKFDVDEVGDLAQELGIRAMPTFTFFKGGEKAAEFVGANPPELTRTLATVIE
ncbi:thioredoxin-like protein [Chaetomium tenue]|uniref:Thioredoxin-like protein n=1 Tax=Chaetomium tenue TaxID=1854479 RepID=A0ACB7P856_9PEZI|nr:thioredoxin-like protein [Chaetomium globosum]